MKTYLYGVNNYSGVAIAGLKDSVYDIKTLYKDDLEIIEEDLGIKETSSKLLNLERVEYFNTKTFEFANSLVKRNTIPVCFAGDHSIAIGTISASSNNYDNLGIIWVDAHADINDENTSPTGNIHGMPLSFLLGYGNKRLSEIGGFSPKIKPENIIYLGLRSVDPGEKEIISKLNIKAYYYDEIEEIGLGKVLEETIEKFSNVENIHLSFDFDSMNPNIFSAVSTPVKGGFNKEDVLEIFNKVSKTKKIKAIDLVEYNKTKDMEANSLHFAIELLDFIKEI